jgi:predicted DNA-binding transcriptional regulator AlpA
MSHAAERKLLCTKEASEYARLSKSMLEKLRVTGTGPVFVKLGKAVRYEVSALDEWIAAQRRKSTNHTSMASAA